MDSTRISGLYIATGTGRKGIKLGPAIGNLMSKMILGGDLRILLNRLFNARVSEN